MRVSRPSEKVAERHNISYDELESIYKDMFLFIKERVVALELNDQTEEEFLKKKTSFVIPKLGKFGTDYDRMKYLNKMVKERNARNKDKKD